MALRRLAKDGPGSVTSGGCPALYSTDDPARMIAQGKILGREESAALESHASETAVAIPAETIFRGLAKYGSEHGDDGLADAIEAFLFSRPALVSIDQRPWLVIRGELLGVAETMQLLEMLDDETAVGVSASSMFRTAADFATRNRDGHLAAAIQAFAAARSLR